MIVVFAAFVLYGALASLTLFQRELSRWEDPRAIRRKAA